MANIERFLREYNIPYIADGHPHNTKGWVNIHCPYCPGSKDYHLGISENGKGAHCWRCGNHSVVKTFSRILGKPEPEIIRLLKEFSGGYVKKTVEEPKIAINPFKFPQPVSEVNCVGEKYLIRRGFDPAKIINNWGLLQTGPISILDMIDYSQRIVIPIYWDGKIVSFQSRDITGKSDRKYLACPMRREIVHHKHIIYGKQEKWQRAKALIVVEGVTDVWRLGHCSVATFGTSFKMEQVLKLASAHEKFFLMFDDEPQAQEQAKKLATKLRALGKKTHIEKIKGDPGGMEQEEANYLVKQIQKRSV